MATTIKMPLTPDAEPTVARAVKILEGPERARRAAEQAAADHAQVDAQQVLVEAARKRRAVLQPIGQDVEAWFKGRPPAEPAQFQQALSDRDRAAVDRVITVGVDLQERAGQPVQDQLDAWTKELAAPLSPSRLEAIIRALASLEESEPGLVRAHAKWREIRAQVAAELSTAVKIVTDTATWISGPTEKEIA